MLEAAEEERRMQRLVRRCETDHGHIRLLSAAHYRVTASSCDHRINTAEKQLRTARRQHARAA